MTQIFNWSETHHRQQIKQIDVIRCDKFRFS